MIRACVNGWSSLAEVLEHFWVAGLALVQIWLGSRWLPLKGEAYGWAQDLLLGALFPALVLTSCILNRRDQRRTTWSVIKWCLLGFCLVFPWFRARNSSLTVLVV